MNSSYIYDQLSTNSEEEYRVFLCRLIPNCTNILGVRMPILRRLAKQIAKSDAITYINEGREQYYEDTMLKGLVIGSSKTDIDTVLTLVAQHLPKIINWSLCDSFCAGLKIAKNYSTEVWQYLQQYCHSNRCYDIRFALVMSIFHFVDKDHIDALLAMCDTITHTDYYVRMAVAWLISMCFVKLPTQTMKYLHHNQLDQWTYNKALQKIVESRQVDADTKATIRGMKRA